MKVFSIFLAGEKKIHFFLLALDEESDQVIVVRGYRAKLRQQIQAKYVSYKSAQHVAPSSSAALAFCGGSSQAISSACAHALGCCR